VAVAAPSDPEAFRLGLRAPRAVAAPASVEALAKLLRASDANGESVVFFGGGTLQSIGNAPSRYDLAISLAKLSKVIAYEHRDLTIAVQSGMRVATLDAKLATKGQFVPLDAPHASRSTVGGVLAAGWLGPRRATYGRPRDFVIGSGVVLADGTIAHAGGMVVKNSTGYDLSRLYVGSLGTLAALVRTNFKTLPLPAARRATVASLPERTQRRAIDHVAALGYEPVAALIVRGFDGEVSGRDGLDGRLLLFYEGSPGTIDKATRELRSALGAAGVPETTILDREAAVTFTRLIDAYVSSLGERGATYRSFGTPSDLTARFELVTALAERHALVLESIEDLRTGDLIARISAPSPDEFTQAAVVFDDALHEQLPYAQVLVAPQNLRDRLSMWGNDPPALPQMRALKLRFDPNGTLAPGRFVGGI
jgi:glycolate oxidase FAD binding subunit